MRDLARRVQALRKELGFMPTDILETVHVAELDPASMKLLEPYLTEMAELVRAKKVYVHGERSEVKAEWHERRLDDKKNTSLYLEGRRAHQFVRLTKSTRKKVFGNPFRMRQ